ncbi:MAG: hypothetical protein RL398_2224 [Planctomycetota bacterium]|jgi:DNA-binding NtrC family response regulator/pSer/pThr/pTyr-binding forkhead associated (FHA) protein
MSEVPAPPGRTLGSFRLLVYGNGSVRTIPLVGERWTIGRAEDCNITLRDPTVSRRHILLERDGMTFRFRDLGGVNPLLIDGVARQEGLLEPGQTIQLGLTRITLERRNQPTTQVSGADETMILSRELIEEEPISPAATAFESVSAGAPARDEFLQMARRVLERIEWAFADMGDLHDAAEPLIELAINLTGRRRGMIARLHPDSGCETLAVVDVLGPSGELRIPEQILRDARALGRPNLVVAQERGRQVERLVVPMGPGPDAVLVLEDPSPEAPAGQPLLRLGRTLGKVIWHRLQETQERMRLRDDVQRLRFHGTIGHQMLLASTRLQDARQRARQLVNNERTVFVLGEPGTERGEMAHFLHHEGTRAKGPFLAISLASMSAHQAEAELFGSGDSPGAIEAARGGTLFLDDIDQLPTAMQDRLLHSLSSEPLRGAAGLRTRLVVASAMAPEDPQAAFSSMLRQRVGAYTLTLPPLRSDARDVLTLAEMILTDLGPNADGTPRLMSERTKKDLAAYGWPQNVRELRRVLEVAASRAGKAQIAPRHLPEYLSEPQHEAPLPELLTLEQLEAKHIGEVILRVGGNRAKAAQLLGIAASTLYDKLRRYSMDQ